MSRKRLAEWDLPPISGQSPSKRQRTVAKPIPSLPRMKYSKHKDSKVGEDFHSVPYPLSLLPKTSWQALNQGEADATCSSCGKARQASAHHRKLFLVAERLSWELGTVSYSARSQNEEALWACNAELGIFEPAVDDEEVVIGGRRSRDDEYYPYQGEVEVEFAMKLVASAEVLSDASWTLWKRMIEKAMAMLQGSREGADSERHPEIHHSSPRRSPRKNGEQPMDLLPTPPSSNVNDNPTAKVVAPRICSYDTLQDFYSLLDKIERTSPMGARFLKAYADRLHTETCSSCWFSTIPTMNDDEEDEPASPLPPSPQALYPQTTPHRSYEPLRYGY